MQRLEDVNLWMGRSPSNLERARSKRENSKILLEDLLENEVLKRAFIRSVITSRIIRV
jgi:hypothetical protein